MVGRNIIILCLSVIILPVLCKKELPSFLQVCKRKDPKLNDCIKSSIYALQPYLGKGIPEMKIQSMDPLSVTQLDLSAAIGEFKFKDLKFGLVNQFNLGEVVLDLDKCYAYMDVHHPIMIVKGVYDIRGKILAIQLEGQGPFDMNATNTNMSVKMNCVREVRNGKEYANFKDIDLKISIEAMSFYLNDLFKNNPELTERMNVVLNENGKSFAEDFEPIIGKAVEEIVSSTVRGVFDTFPLDVILPE